MNPHDFNNTLSPGDFVDPGLEDWAAPPHMQHLLPSQIKDTMTFYSHAFCLWQSIAIHAHPYQGGHLILIGIN